jgi:hypothetical protein
MFVSFPFSINSVFLEDIVLAIALFPVDFQYFLLLLLVALGTLPFLLATAILPHANAFHVSIPGVHGDAPKATNLDPL